MNKHAESSYCKVGCGFSIMARQHHHGAGAPRVFTKNGTPLPLSLAANIYSQVVPVQLQLEPYVSNASEKYRSQEILPVSNRRPNGTFFL